MGYPDVMGRRFASDGTPRGDDFVVNTYTTGYQHAPSVAMEPDGDFVVVWQSGYIGADVDIFGQRFSSSGTPKGVEFQVNTTTTGSQKLPSVSSDSNGDFVVAWQGPGEGGYGDVFAQRFVVPYPVILAGLGATTAGGWAELLGSTLVNESWLRVPWTAYNSAVGETRPAICNLDTDVKQEVVLGLGSYAGAGTGGYVEIKDDADSAYAHLDWLRLAFASYNASNGETFPACGDLDGDGRDEIVVGLGDGGGGWVQVFDDAVGGFAPLEGTPFEGGWIRVNWTTYNNVRGEVHPAVGNMDGDAREELILGLGLHSSGWVQVLDDASAGFTPLSGTPTAGGWLRLAYNTYNVTNGETWPAVGDLNGDGQAELALGVGEDGNGWVQVLGNATTTFAPAAGTPYGDGFLRVAWNAYNSVVSAAYPAAGDIDRDGRDELVLGLGTFPANGGWMEVRDDLSGGLAHISWARVHWGAYNSTNGLTRPAIPD